MVQLPLETLGIPLSPEELIPVPPLRAAMAVPFQVPLVTEPAEVTLKALVPMTRAAPGLELPIPTLPSMIALLAGAEAVA